MLFVLTGNIQIGKTRWLESMISELQDKGVASYGVIAPGVWIDRRNDSNPSSFVDANGFEKTGIDNVLLPNQTRIRFATRKDIAVSSNSFNENNQSARAGLGWHISDSAIQQVNSHFKQVETNIASETKPALLIVDELGQLELARGGGLTEAVSLLKSGPYPAVQHVLIVVRETLLPLLEGKFDNWGEVVLIGPNDESRQAILDAFKLS